jgi:hypothetical protein
MKADNKKQVLIKLDKQKYQALHELSFYTDTPMMEIVSQALTDWGLLDKALEAKQNEDHLE